MCQRDQHRMKSILEEKSEVTEKENAPNLDLKNGSVEFCNVCFGLICGRFEGIDQRVIDHYGVSGISVGDYVLSGGEVAAMVVVDACVRLLPDVLRSVK